MYADDTTLLLQGTTTEELAVTSFVALNMAFQYCNGNDLVANPSKTSQLAFGRRALNVPVMPEINMENQTKFLGITIDEELSWTPHIDNLTKKLNTSLYIIKQIKSISGDNAAKTAYYSIFESHVRYGLIVWGGTSAANLHRTLLVQKKCIRALAGLGYNETCREVFKTLKILTIVALYIQEVVMFVDGEDLPRQRDTHQHNTRHATHFNLPSHHLSLYQKKPTYSGRKLFNHLPQELQTKTGTALKTALHRWLLDRPFYTLSEFFQHEI